MNKAYSNNGESWRYVDVGWTLSEDEILFNHDPTDIELDLAFPERKSLIRLRQWERIKAERDRRKAGGVKVKVGTVDKWFHSDEASRIQQMGLVLMGANIPANLQWKTLDGSFVTMTQAVAQSVFAATAASDQSIFAVAEGHRAALAACEDPAAYDYSTGWPAIFGE